MSSDEMHAAWSRWLKERIEPDDVKHLRRIYSRLECASTE